jgi:hypothetical protein
MKNDMVGSKKTHLEFGVKEPFEEEANWWDGFAMEGRNGG